MAYKHGVYCSEIPTSIIPAVNSLAGLPVVFGAAPLHLATEPAEANKPILCYSYAEAVKKLGYSKDWDKYSLCEVMYSQFALYNRAPVVFVNVLNPALHKATVALASVTKEAGIKTITVDAPVIASSFKLRESEAGQPLVVGTDYDVAFNDEEKFVVTFLTDTLIQATSVWIEYDKIDPSQISAATIIGGVDSQGNPTGLECLNLVFPVLGLVPGLIAAPGYSHDSSVAAVMKAKASNINSHFQAMAVCDIPTDEVTSYTAASEWKNQHSYNDPLQIACWPMVKLGESIYHMSTHVLGVIATVDSANDDVPFESPSNKSMSIDGACLKDGSEVILGPDEANYLNGQGIVTCLNFIGGWKCWGNRTACYPSNTDAKDAFISIKRMFIWHAQTFIQTYWAKIDKPITKRLIQTVVDSENIRLNGLVAQGAILGGRVEFREEENVTTDLLDGIIKFHTMITPPTPARVIENVIEYDPSYFQTLFA